MSTRSCSINRNLPRGLPVIYEDDDILVVDKQSGLLTISTDREKSKTVYSMLTDYVRRGCNRSQRRVFIVHRLDRETSGILVFAKNIEAKKVLQGNWDETEKKYIALVYGRCKKEEDTITSYLAENSAHLVYSTKDREKGKLSQTHYRVLKQTDRYSLLEIDLMTGRKHQIRVHLSGIGHPVVGDRKYGAGEGGGKRLALHAKSISFTHPANGRRLYFEAELPSIFTTFKGFLDKKDFKKK